MADVILLCYHVRQNVGRQQVFRNHINPLEKFNIQRNNKFRCSCHFLPFFKDIFELFMPLMARGRQWME